MSALSFPAAPPLPLTPATEAPAKCDVAVIGAGAGGALAATLLAEGGRDTVLIEEGDFYPQGRYPPFGKQEMLAAMRRGGMTVALGAAAINYVEARCVGGGSEINSGLYHRPPAAALARWAAAGVTGADGADMQDYCQQNERDLGITKMPGAAQPASLKLAAGAAALNLSCGEVPRWHQYGDDFSPQAPGGVRNSMARVFLPRFIDAGGRLLANCEVTRLEREGGARHGHWRILASAGGAPHTLRAGAVFVCAGATRTPQLLRASGYKRAIGNTLRMHVFARVIAEFAEPVNDHNAGIGPHQIDALAPRLRFGCGVSSPAHIAAALAQCGSDWLADHRDKWRRRAAYYATIGGGMGRVRALGQGNEAVFYRLHKNDYYDLADGIRVLSRLLFAAGARRVQPVIKFMPTLHGEGDQWRLPRPLPAVRSCLSSVHLMGSCPLGERGAADGDGAIYGAPNLYIADASLFCDSPNVNPQGTVMAFSRRIARRYLAVS